MNKHAHVNQHFWASFLQYVIRTLVAQTQWKYYQRDEYKKDCWMAWNFQIGFNYIHLPKQ